MVFGVGLSASSANSTQGFAYLLIIIGLFSGPPIVFLELRKRARRRRQAEIPVDAAQAVTQRSQSVVAPSSALFEVAAVVAFVCEIFGALVWSAAAAVHDPGGANGALVFLVLTGIALLAVIGASRNIKLFVQQDVVGCVGPLGGVRLCQRAELIEVRTVWHWYQGRGMGSWIFPTLHFRRRDGSDAFVTPAILYKNDGLQALASQLRIPIDLERPTDRRAA